MEHSAHFYESRPLLVDWLYRAVRAGMQAGDTCIVITRPDIRASLERLLDLDFDVTAAAAWGLYAYVDVGETLGTESGGAGFDEAAFGEWFADLVSEAEAAGRRVSVWTEVGDVLRERGNDQAMQGIERLWDTARKNVSAVTCLFRMPVGTSTEERNWVEAIRETHRNP